jgi:hypothetical protein
MDKLLNFSINSAPESKICLGFFELLNYFKSCPEQKTGPSPSKTKILIKFTLPLLFSPELLTLLLLMNSSKAKLPLKKECSFF